MTRLSHDQELCNKLPEENQETIGDFSAVDFCAWSKRVATMEVEYDLHTATIGKITMVLGKNHYHLIQLSGL